MTCRSKIELVRLSSTEREKIRPLLEDATQMKAQYEHVRSCDYATYNHVTSRLRSNGSAQSNILKLATKSCDNIFARQMKRVESPFIWRDATRSEEQLFPPRQTGARSRLAALLKKLSPRPRRSKSLTCPWVVIEFNDTKPHSPNHLSPVDIQLEERSASVESDKSFEMAVELNRQRLNATAGPPLNTSKVIVSSGNMPAIITPKILVASPEKTSYRKHQNKYVKSRKHLSNSSSTCKSDLLTVASRPHTLLLPSAGELREPSGQAAAAQRRMASYESIGSCSLDVDVTASDSASELCNSGSVSERTLHSLALSVRTPGSTTPEYVKRTAQLFETSQQSTDTSPQGFPGSPSTNLEDLGKENYPDKGNVRVVLPHQNLNTLQVRGSCNNTETLYNGSKDSKEVTKKPSYLGLACSISGYTTITNYDSKLRDGFRSRDHSPGRLVIRSREVSPIRPNQDQIDNANLRFKSDCGNYLVPPRPPEKGNRSDNSIKSDLLRNDQKLDVRTLKQNILIVNGATKSDVKMSENSDDNLVTSGATLRESSRNFMSTMLSANTYTSSSYEVTSSFQSPGSNYESPTKNKFKNGFQGDLNLGSNGSMPNNTNGSLKPTSLKGFEELTLPDGCPQKRSPGAVRVVEFTSQTKSYVQNGQSGPPLKSSTYSSSKFTDSKNQFLESKPQSTFANSKSNPKSQFSEQKSEFSRLTEAKPQQLEQKTVTHDIVLTESRSYLNSNVGTSETTSVWTGTPSNKSFIQQRVERLYGPGALAQGFFRRTGSSPLSPALSPYQGGGHESSSPGGQAALPVLRHLRPEFRAQLSISSRKESRNKENQVVKIIPVEIASELRAEKIFPVTERKTQPTALQQQVSVESISEHLPAAPEVVLPPQQVVTPIAQSEASVVKDGRYFLSILRQEIEQLNKMVEAMERDMEAGGENIPEEVSGQLRAATGQARLLVKQKLQQFEGLCHKNMAQDPEEQFPTTCEDLAGFWDMVKLQVDQVHGLFADLNRLKDAGWNKEKLLETDEVDGSQRNSSPKKRPGGVSKRALKTAAPSVNEEARKAREDARRKLMEEKRRQMREKNKQATEDIVEIFVPQDNGK